MFDRMNHPAWAGDLTAAQREMAFGNGQNQLGFSILRIHVDENRNNWYKEVETAKSAVKHGLYFSRLADVSPLRLKVSTISLGGFQGEAKTIAPCLTALFAVSTSLYQLFRFSST